MSVLRKRKRFMFAKCPRRVTLNLSQIEKQNQSNYRVKKKIVKTNSEKSLKLSNRGQSIIRSYL